MSSFSKAKGKIKILCLHGKTQNREVMRSRMGRIPSKSKHIAEYTYIDAPHFLELKEGDDIPMRTWVNRDNDGIVNLVSLETSLIYLENVWKGAIIPESLKKSDDNNKNENFQSYDGILGFSQGGTMAGVMSSLPLRFPGIKFVICIGAPDLSNGMPNLPKISSSIHSLHLAGITDAVVPLKLSKKLYERFGGNDTLSTISRFIEHPMGHCIPMKAPFIGEIVNFIDEVDKRITIQNDSITLLNDGKCLILHSDINNNNHNNNDNNNNSDNKIISSIYLCSSDSNAVQQSDEIEALLAIYPDFISVHQSAPSIKGEPCGRISYKLNVSELSIINSIILPPKIWFDNLKININFTPSYPEEDIPKFDLDVGKLSMLDITSFQRRSLLTTIHNAISIGDPSVFLIIQAVEEWILSNWQNLSSTSASTTELLLLEEEEDTKSVYINSVDKTSKNPILISLQKEGEESEELLENERVRIATSEAFLSAAKYINNIDIEDNSEEAFLLSDEVTGFFASSSARGLWNFKVGLVGKPSAGKSTFFNAVTRAALHKDGSRMAEVAPHPFTTIEPNIAAGWYAGPIDNDDSNSRVTIYGRDRFCRRLMPVIVKDVAGLVPGAYKGRGKGNRFLSDLCDADVLVHVVDATGKADRDGNSVINDIIDDEQSTEAIITELKDSKRINSSPTEDAEWIREELHRWIYGNVKGKWHSVVRIKTMSKDKVSSRVHALFSGYKGVRSCLERASRRAELDLDKAGQWDTLDLHRLVAHYLSIRFPMCLALNKVDSFTDSNHGDIIISTCQQQAKARGENAVPVSAAVESWMLLKEAFASNERGSIKLPSEGSILWNSQEKAMTKVLTKYGSSGVLDALSAAVKLRPPIYVYPVTDLESESPIGWTTGKQLSLGFQEKNDSKINSIQIPKLRDCLLFKPGSTAGDVYEALKHGALSHVIVHGEFVRAEARGLDPQSRKKQIGKETIIDETCCVIRIQTNRKPVWQKELNI